jgi:hypothetical protein
MLVMIPNRFATSRLKNLVEDHFTTFTTPEQLGLRMYPSLCPLDSSNVLNRIQCSGTKQQDQFDTHGRCSVRLIDRTLDRTVWLESGAQ